MEIGRHTNEKRFKSRTGTTRYTIVIIKRNYPIINTNLDVKEKASWFLNVNMQKVSIKK